MPTKLAQFPQHRQSISAKNKPYRLKCNQGNFQCGARCVPVQYKSKSSGKMAYTNCRKNATGMAKTGLEWLEYVDSRKQRVEGKFKGKFTTDSQGKIVSKPGAKLMKPQDKAISLPSVDTPIAIAEINEMIDRIKKGDITGAEIQNNWARFKNSKAAIAAELTKLTVAQLKAKYPTHYAERKADYVATGIRDLESNFNPTNSLSFNPMEKGSMERAMEATVKLWTDDRVQEIAANHRRNKEAGVAELNRIKKAVENPETLKDFDTFIRLKGKGALSISQSALYDELQAKAGREARKAKEEDDRQKGIKSSQDVKDVSLNISEHTHSQKQKPLIAVSPSKLLPKDDYYALLKVAKQYGGYKGRQWGTTPGGYHFMDSDKSVALANAKAFVEASKKFLGGETVTVTPTKGNDLVPKNNPASDRLKGLAQSLREKAEATLNRGALTNTARRARMAAGIDEAARKDIALAETMSNLAEAIATNQVQFLDKIKTKADVVQLEDSLRWAKNNAYADWIKKNPNAPGSQRQNERERPPRLEDIAFADGMEPSYFAWQVRELVGNIENVDGLKLVAGRLKKRLQGISTDDDRTRVPFLDPQGLADIRAIAKKSTDPKMRGMLADRIREDLKDYDRLQRMGITNNAELRTALREFIQYRGKKQKEDPIKKIEREMIGVKIDGYFPTPKPLAAKMAVRLGVEDGDRVLEPSAGIGYLLDAVQSYAKGRPQLTVIEISPTLATALKAKGYDPIQSDFLGHKGEYDKIIMNPPFERGQDIDHVRHAYDLLAPGGRMVAIMSEGPFFRSDKKATEFRDWLDDLDSVNEKLPQGTFLASDRSTGVSTRLVEIEKPDDAPTPKKKALITAIAPITEQVKSQGKTSPSVTPGDTIRPTNPKIDLGTVTVSRMSSHTDGNVTLAKIGFKSPIPGDRNVYFADVKLENGKLADLRVDPKSRSFVFNNARDAELLVKEAIAKNPKQFNSFLTDSETGDRLSKSPTMTPDQAFDLTLKIMEGGNRDVQGQILSEVFGGKTNFSPRSPLYPAAEEAQKVGISLRQIKQGNDFRSIISLGKKGEFSDRGRKILVDALNEKYTAPTVKKALELVNSYQELNKEWSAIYGGDVDYTKGRFGNGSRAHELSAYNNAKGRIGDEIDALFRDDWKNKAPKPVDFSQRRSPNTIKLGDRFTRMRRIFRRYSA